MKKNRVSIALLSMLLSSTTFAADWTPTPGKEIGIMQTAESGITYIRANGDAPWAMPGCPNAIYAAIWPYASTKPEGPDRIFSQALAARYHNEKVRLRGECGAPASNGVITTFKVDYIMVMPN